MGNPSQNNGLGFLLFIMGFNSTTAKDGLIQLTEGLTNLGDAGISGNATLLKQITAYVNQGYGKVANGLLTVDNNWQWDDSNHTDYPRGVQDLVADQKEYTLPVSESGLDASTLFKVNKVAILDSASQERIVTLTHKPEAWLNNTYDTSGYPTVYRLQGKTLKLWPAPDSGTQVTLTSGLIVYYQRSFNLFASTDTTQEPGFNAGYHDMLADYAASVYLMPTNTNLAITYMQLFTKKLEDLKDTYAQAVDDAPNRIITRYRSSR